MPAASATSIPAAASSIVAGKRSAISRETGFAIRDRFTKIADGESAQICGVLLQERTIEAELMAHTDNVGGRGGLTEHRNHRIARHEMDDREGQRHDTERDGNEREQAPDEIVDHCITATNLRRRRRAR